MLEKQETRPIDVQDDDAQSIVTRKERREITKPSRYANYLRVASCNPIAYALVVAESIDSDEP